MTGSNGASSETRGPVDFGGNVGVHGKDSSGRDIGIRRNYGILTDKRLVQIVVWIVGE